MTRIFTDGWDSAKRETDSTEPDAMLGDVNEAADALLDQREADLDQDASAEISHEDFMGYFAARLQK